MYILCICYENKYGHKTGITNLLVLGQEFEPDDEDCRTRHQSYHRWPNLTDCPNKNDDLRGNRRLCSKYKLAAWSINRVINLRFKVQKQNPFFLLLTIFVSDVDWKLFIN